MSEENRRWGLIDYNIFKAENGMWILSETYHRQPSPGDANPEPGDMSLEFDSKSEALAAAIEEAKTAILTEETESAVVFVDGEEVWSGDKDSISAF